MLEYINRGHDILKEMGWDIPLWLYYGLVVLFIPLCWAIAKQVTEIYQKNIFPKKEPPSPEEIAKALIKAQEERDGKVKFQQEEIDNLKKTIEALQKEKGPGIKEALELLAKGDTSGAEAIFYAIARKGKVRAAEALINAGNLAFLHDTQKALAAYREATELDPRNPKAWNQLGRILKRTGDLGGAEAAYLRVDKLAGGDKKWLAIAYGIILGGN